MKNIKCAVWLKNSKEIQDVIAVQWNKNKEIIHVTTKKTICNANQVEFLLYTGIKDRNGNEIREGDIVSCDGYLWKIVWKEDEACFSLEGIYDNLIATFDNYRGDECEVLGNIYENPELLGEEYKE